MLTPSIPINHNSLFKSTGRELHFPAPCSAPSIELYSQSLHLLPERDEANRAITSKHKNGRVYSNEAFSFFITKKHKKRAKCDSSLRAAPLKTFL